MELLQVLKGASAQPRGLFYVDGVLTDIDAAGVPTVTLTRPDGTAGPASGAVTRVSLGTYTFTLAAASTAQVTIYTVTWSGNIGGQPQTITTQVEVVGEFLFTLAALRATKVASGLPFADTTTYPNQLLLDTRTEVTDDFAGRCGHSFVPRFARETHNGTDRDALALDEHTHGPATLLSVTVDGVAEALGGWTLEESGVLRSTSGFRPVGVIRGGIANVVAEYVHGFAKPPAAVSTAGLARAAMLLLPSQSSAVSSWTTPDGTTYSYDQAGQRFRGGGLRHYGVPGIDAVLNESAYTCKGDP